MNDHDTIRKLLPLAAADALNADELRRVEQHARECESCGREMQVWGLYSQGLRQQPQPSAPADLLMRAQVRVLRERAHAADRRRDAIMLGALACMSLMCSVMSWLVARALTGGVLEMFGTNWMSPVPWFLGSTALTWMTAATAAIALGGRPMRRTL